MLVAVDVDGVVADLHAEWLRLYNDDYGDKLRPQDITKWAIHELVKPECGDKIFDYLRRPDLYSKVPPILGAKEGVAEIRANGHRVVFVSSAVLGSLDQKFKWLIDNGFLKNKGGRPDSDLVFSHDKTLIKADMLIDDGLHNVKGWEHALLVDAPYNHEDTTATRVYNWATIPLAVEVIDVELTQAAQEDGGYGS
jgi:5'(3')-deoxyribonucleotidase